MTHFIDPQTETADRRDSGEAGARLAFENAYRLKKKTLIGEIKRSLGLRYPGTAPRLSAR